MDDELVEHQHLNGQKKVHSRIHDAEPHDFRQGLSADKPHEMQGIALPEEMDDENGHAENAADDRAQADARDADDPAKDDGGQNVSSDLQRIGQIADQFVSVVVD